MKALVEDEKLAQRIVADRFGVNLSVVHRLVREHGWKTQRTGPRSGPGHPDWKGGRCFDKDGYMQVYTPGHPHARRRGASPPVYVPEHRLVMEQKLGRYLLPGEVVHHVNGVKSDNRIENLELFQSNGDHLRHELTGRCPKWSEDGKARIRAAVLRSNETNRQRKALRESQRLQSLAHSTE